MAEATTVKVTLPNSQTVSSTGSAVKMQLAGPDLEEIKRVAMQMYMTLAGKYGAGVLSIGSMSTAGLQNLSTQWSFAEESAEKHGNVVDRSNWRIVLMWHIAETREKAIEESRDGLLRWHNEYNVGTLMRPGVEAFGDREEAVEKTAFADGAARRSASPAAIGIATVEGAPQLGPPSNLEMLRQSLAHVANEHPQGMAQTLRLWLHEEGRSE